jgi:voltage-gated potassium channel
MEATRTNQHSNAYHIFIIVITILSLILMVALWLPLSDATITLLQRYDNLICFIFLVDFILNLRASPKKSDYFIREGGWLDLLGSTPSLGLSFRFSGIFRLARLSRLARVIRLLRQKNQVEVVADVVKHRHQYAMFITALAATIVLTLASVLVLQFESASPEANIQSGWDSLWYSIVTITTVGYGDRYPITVGGRIAGMFVMLMGLGIIGALASILASLLVGASSSEAEQQAATEAASSAVLAPAPAQEKEPALARADGFTAELADMRQLLEEQQKANMALKAKIERLEKQWLSHSDK